MSFLDKTGLKTLFTLISEKFSKITTEFDEKLSSTKKEIEDNIRLKRTVEKSSYPPSGSNYHKIYYGNNSYIAFFGNTSDKSIAYSKDGFSWETVDTSISNYTFNDVCFGNGVFVGVSNDGIFYSNTGKDWNKASSITSKNWIKVTYGSNRFVAVAYNKIAYSKDGTSWTEVALSGSAEPSNICFGNNKFVIIERYGEGGYCSTDAITWTEFTLPSISSSSEWTGLAFGNGIFVTTSYNSTVAAYSEDGVTWNKITMPTNGSYQSMSYGNGKFVSVCYYSNKAAYSEDGKKWSLTTFPTTSGSQSVIFDGKKFVSLTMKSDKQIVFSEDGINWSETFLDVKEKVEYQDLSDEVIKKMGSVSSHLINLKASDWVESKQAVTVNGISADESAQVILPIPAIASQSAYNAAGILATGQAANSITFTATTVPTANLSVYIVITEVTA